VIALNWKRRKNGHAAVIWMSEKETRSQRRVRENMESRKGLHQEWPVNLVSSRKIIITGAVIFIIAAYCIIFYAVL
jgi:hypothetical protein